MSAARVLIVSGRKLMREGLTRLLAGEPRIKVCGEADDAATATKMILPMDISVVVLILTSHATHGGELIRMLTAIQPGLRVVALPMHASPALLQRLLRAGARGCLSRDCDSRDIIAAIRTVVAGGTYVSPAFTATQQTSAATDPTGSGEPLMQDVVGFLAPREREILSRIASGESTKETAFALNVSVKTIETHRRRIMQKLGLFSVAELTQYALTEGLIPFPPVHIRTSSASRR